VSFSQRSAPTAMRWRPDWTGRPGAVSPARPTYIEDERWIVMACSSPRWGPLHVHRVVFHLYRVGGHVIGHGPTQQLAGAHVERREVQRALDDVAFERPFRQRRLAMTTGIPQGVEHTLDVRNQHSLTVDDEPLHRPRRELGRRDHRHEAIEHPG